MLDLIRFNKFCNENKDLKPLDAIKVYNEKYPEKTSREKLINLSRILRIGGLYKALTGLELPVEDQEKG
jgi:hypothetical protein